MRARDKKYLSGMLSAGALIIALPVSAAEATADAGGLPQFDVSFFPGQLFWLAISFVVLYVLMAFVALPKVKRTQDNRHAVMAAELTAASEANAKAKEIVDSYEKALVKARQKAHVTVDGIMATAAKISAEQQAVQNQELHARLREAEAKIATAREAALANAPVTAADIANGIIQRVAGINVRVKA